MSEHRSRDEPTISFMKHNALPREHKEANVMKFRAWLSVSGRSGCLGGRAIADCRAEADRNHKSMPCEIHGGAFVCPCLVSRTLVRVLALQL